MSKSKEPKRSRGLLDFEQAVSKSRPSNEGDSSRASVRESPPGSQDSGSQERRHAVMGYTGLERRRKMRELHGSKPQRREERRSA